jgi:flagellar FliL protein
MTSSMTQTLLPRSRQSHRGSNGAVTLRDSFLQVLFNHANLGGFEGEFTDSSNLDVLRNSLREIGRRDLGDGISDVLIMEVARQDY